MPVLVRLHEDLCKFASNGTTFGDEVTTFFSECYETVVVNHGKHFFLVAVLL